MNTHITRSRTGSVIAVALVFAIILGILLFSLLRFGLTEMRLNKEQATWSASRYGAESILEYGMGEMSRRVQKNSSFSLDTMLANKTPLVAPPTAFFTIPATDKRTPHIDPASIRIIGGKFSTPAPYTVPVNMVDPFSGQTVTMTAAKVFAQATAIDPSDNSRTTSWCSSEIQIRYRPWLQELGNYLPDLEIAPGPQMDCYGEFSTAGNLYVQSNERLNFWRKIICGGSLFHGRKPGSGQSASDGVVALVNGSGTLVNMKQSGNWITSATANFDQLALDLWDGNLLTGSQGANPPGVPGFEDYTPYSAADDTSNSAHKLIEKPIPSTNTSVDSKGNSVYDPNTEIQKFANLSGLVITISNTGTIKAWKYRADPSGTYTRASATGEPEQYSREEVFLPTAAASKIVTPVAAGTFFDKRRNPTTALPLYDVNIGNLRKAINGTNAADQITAGSGSGFNKSTDWNGAVFVEMENPAAASVRVINGQQIPDYGHQSGLTFGTNAPLYVKGHFNADGSLPSTTSQMGLPDTSTEPPAALVADAITVLSPNWDDSKSGLDLSKRNKPTPVEIAAAFVGGIVPSSGNKYSGGFENYPRFLENWSGVTVGYRGAVLALFDSEIATQPWGSSNVYEAPKRLWAYNELYRTDTPKFPVPPRSPNRVGFTEYKSQAEFDAAVAAAQ